jgi:hypothetical protein
MAGAKESAGSPSEGSASRAPERTGATPKKSLTAGVPLDPIVPEQRSSRRWLIRAGDSHRAAVTEQRPDRGRVTVPITSRLASLGIHHSSPQDAVGEGGCTDGEILRHKGSGCRTASIAGCS